MVVFGKVPPLRHWRKSKYPRGIRTILPVEPARLPKDATQVRMAASLKGTKAWRIPHKGSASFHETYLHGAVSAEIAVNYGWPKAEEYRVTLGGYLVGQEAGKLILIRPPTHKRSMFLSPPSGWIFSEPLGVDCPSRKAARELLIQALPSIAQKSRFARPGTKTGPVWLQKEMASGRNVWFLFLQPAAFSKRR